MKRLLFVIVALCLLFPVAARDFTLRLWDRGELVLDTVVPAGATVTLPACTVPCDGEFIYFQGWTDTESEQWHSLPATRYTAGTFYTVTENTNLYALWADWPRAEHFQQVDWVEYGDTICFANSNGEFTDIGAPLSPLASDAYGTYVAGQLVFEVQGWETALQYALSPYFSASKWSKHFDMSTIVSLYAYERDQYLCWTRPTDYQADLIWRDQLPTGSWDNVGDTAYYFDLDVPYTASTFHTSFYAVSFYIGAREDGTYNLTYTTEAPYTDLAIYKKVPVRYTSQPCNHSCISVLNVKHEYLDFRYDPWIKTVPPPIPYTYFKEVTPSTYYVCSGKNSNDGKPNFKTETTAQLLFTPSAERPYLIVPFTATIKRGGSGRDDSYPRIQIRAYKYQDYGYTSIGCDPLYWEANDAGSWVSNINDVSQRTVYSSWWYLSPQSGAPTIAPMMSYTGSVIYDFSAYIGTSVVLEVFARTCGTEYCYSEATVTPQCWGKIRLCQNDTSAILLTAPRDMRAYAWTRGESSEVIGTDSVLLIHEADNYYCTLTPSACDPQRLQIAEVLPVSDTAIYADTICQGDSILWHGQYYSQAGYMGSDTLSQVLTGCDSIRSYYLTVLPTTYWETDRSICLGDSIYLLHRYFYTDTTVVDTMINAQGCDSIVTVHVHVVPPVYSHSDYTMCLGQSIRIRDREYTAPGTYRDTLKTAMGCDSIEIMQITVVNCDPRPHPLNPQGLDCDTCCDTVYSTTYMQIYEKELPTFEWNGIPMNKIPQNERQDTTLVAPLQKFDLSCDSIATLHLHVLEPCEVPSTYLPVRWKKE